MISYSFTMMVKFVKFGPFAEMLRPSNSRNLGGAEESVFFDEDDLPSRDVSVAASPAMPERSQSTLPEKRGSGMVSKDFKRIVEQLVHQHLLELEQLRVQLILNEPPHPASPN